MRFENHISMNYFRKDEGRSVMRLLFDLQDSDASAGQPYLVRQLVLLAMEASGERKFPRVVLGKSVIWRGILRMNSSGLRAWKQKDIS
jgi:hypothetical protein